MKVLFVFIARVAIVFGAMTIAQHGPLGVLCAAVAFVLLTEPPK